MAEQDRLAVLANSQLRRNRSVEGPDRIQVLRRQPRMELQWNRRRGIDAGIEVGSDAGVVNGVGGCTRLAGFHGDLRRKHIKTLMGPDGSRWTAFNGAGAAAQNRGNRLL